METKKTLLTEVLQPSQTGSEPLAPFNETLTDILLGTWTKPCMWAPVSRPISGRHDLPPGDRMSVVSGTSVS